MNQELSINKLDAARRQLEVAVRLYFDEDDSVSIHTLTAAAHQILSDVNKARNGRPLLKEAILECVKPEKKAEARGLLNAAANFFKHANRDSNESLVFAPSQTEVFLFDACRKYGDLTGELVPTLGMYQAWFWLDPGAELVDVTQERVVAGLRTVFPGATRRTFFAKALPMVSKIKVSKFGG